ncbi:MAG: hypothetical protein RI932_1526 [Pseudomonadota bacterium]
MAPFRTTHSELCLLCGDRSPNIFGIDHLLSTHKILLKTSVGAWQVGLSSDRRVRRRIRRRHRIHGRLGEALVGELRLL